MTTKKALTTTRTSEAVKAEIVTIDKKLVDEAVKWIRDTALEGIKKTLIEVGDYILKRFFNDDIELARSKNPLKNASFRALAERCGTTDFPVSDLRVACAGSARCAVAPPHRHPAARASAASWSSICWSRM